MLASCGGGGGGGGSAGGTSDNSQNNADGSISEVFSGLVSPQMMTAYSGVLYVADRVSPTSGVTGTIRVIYPDKQATNKTLGTVDSPVSPSFRKASLFTTGTNPISYTGVLLVDQSVGTLTNYIQVSDPAGLVFDERDVGYVSDPSSGGVFYFVDNSNKTRISVGESPSGLAYHDGYVYVTRWAATANDDALYRFQAGAGASASSFAKSTLFKQPNPIAVRQTPQVEFYVANTGGTVNDRNILKVSADGGTVQIFLNAANPSHKVCSPTGLAIDGSTLYFANSTCAGSVNAAYAGKVMRVTLP